MGVIGCFISWFFVYNKGVDENLRLNLKSILDSYSLDENSNIQGTRNYIPKDLKHVFDCFHKKYQECGDAFWRSDVMGVLNKIVNRVRNKVDPNYDIKTRLDEAASIKNLEIILEINNKNN